MSKKQKSNGASPSTNYRSKSNIDTSNVIIDFVKTTSSLHSNYESFGAYSGQNATRKQNVKVIRSTHPRVHISKICNCTL